MSKRIRTLLVAVVALVVLGGGLAALLMLGGEEDDPSTSSSVPSEPDTSATLISKLQRQDGTEVTDPVKTFHIKTLFEEFTISQGEDGILSLEDCRDLPRNPYEIQALTDELAVIAATKTISKTGEDINLDEFGFDRPQAKVSVTYYDDTEFQFELAPLPLGNAGYYLRVPETGAVYVVEAEWGSIVTREKKTYIGLELFHSPTVHQEDADGVPVLKRLQLTGSVRKNQQIDLHMKDPSDSVQFENSNYIITKPYHVDANMENHPQIQQALSLTADEVVILRPTEEQKKEYLLDRDNAYSVGAITTAIYTVEKDERDNVTNYGYYNETTHLVLLGKKNQDGQYYAMVDAYDCIYLLSPDAVPWAEKQYSDLVSPFTFLSKIVNVDNVTVTLHGEEIVFKLTHHPDAPKLEQQMEVFVGDKQYDSEDFRTLYQVLMTITRTGEAPAEPTGEPVLIIKVTPNDPAYRVNEIAIYKHSVNLYICRSNTGDTYKVTATVVEHAIKQIENYLAGRPVYKN